VKVSGIEKATRVLLLLSLGFFPGLSALAQQEPLADSESSEPGNIRVLHFERPLSLEDLEAGRIILDSDPVRQSVELPAPPVSSYFVNLASNDGAYLRRLRDIENYEQVLEQLEYSGGAWSVELAQELEALGALLYEQGDFEESIEVLERAVHVNRVNYGLYSPQQIPLLQRQIAGHIALEQWREADTLQQYAFYAQNRAFGATDARMISVYQSLARWNLVLFFRQVDADPSPRLLQTYQLFRAAAGGVRAHFGPRDARYMSLLRDMAGASDMLERYALPGSATPTTGNPELRTVRTDYGGGDFGTRASSRDNSGEQALLRLIEQHKRRQDPSDEASLAQAEAMAALGDWYQMHNRRQAAQRAYADAYRFLAEHERAETLLPRQFDRIVFLPTFSTFDEQKKQALGLSPHSGARQGYIDLSFNVSKYGRVSDLEVLAKEPAGVERVDVQVGSHLRAYTIRPRMKDGIPADSERERYRFPFWY